MMIDAMSMAACTDWTAIANKAAGALITVTLIIAMAWMAKDP